MRILCDVTYQAEVCPAKEDFVLFMLEVIGSSLVVVRKEDTDRVRLRHVLDLTPDVLCELLSEVGLLSELRWL